MISEYETLLEEILDALTPANHPVAVELAALPLSVRGFGHVKQANLARAKAMEATLLSRFRSPLPSQAIAAE
jgi:indolepyruvate ferredoxin oxidoreductase